MLREIDELAEDGFNQWRDFATPVQKAIGSAENDRWVNDPDFASKQEQFMYESFKAADKDNDGLLNQQEFKVFYKMLMEDGAKRGNYEDPRPETISSCYQLCNRINIHRPGVGMQDWSVVVFSLAAKTKELRQRSGF